MNIAIRTKYLPVTNHRGSRITASPMVNANTKQHLAVQSVTVGYYEFDGDSLAKHAAVAALLAERLNWHGMWYAGDDGAGGYVFVRTVGTGEHPAFTTKRQEG